MLVILKNPVVLIDSVHLRTATAALETVVTIMKLGNSLLLHGSMCQQFRLCSPIHLTVGVV